MSRICGVIKTDCGVFYNLKFCNMIRVSNVLVSPTDLLTVGIQIMKVDYRTNEK